MGPALELLWGNVGAGALQWKAEGWEGVRQGQVGCPRWLGRENNTWGDGGCKKGGRALRHWRMGGSEREWLEMVRERKVCSSYTEPLCWW